MLGACFGVECLLKLGSVSFPSSVAGLIILFLALLLSEQVLGEHRTRRFVAWVDIPGGWSLRWIGVFFTPSFVLLPLSPPIGIIEVFKIIAVFLIGFLVMMVLTAYMARSLQLIFGSSKRAMTERAEELGRDGRDNNEDDQIPMTALSPPRSGDVTPAPTPGVLSEVPSSVDVRSLDPPPRAQRRSLHLERHTPEDTSASASASASASSRHEPPPTPSTDVVAPLPAQAPPPPARATKWAALLASRLDVFTYGALFLLAGLPTYYAAGYAMPLHLSLGVLAYFAATTAVPPAWRRFLHPVLVSSLLTVLGLWVLGLVRGDDLRASLAQYRTGAKYSTLWADSAGGSGSLPGAGDMFGSVLDASIVALALPMYQYRRELRAHLTAIAVPNIVVAVASLFAYPPLCRAIGIGAERSLAFAARSLTLALATPAAANLGGDANTVAAIAIMSGILGVLIGQRMLGFLRIPEDDYVTRGVTLGANSSAIATALLLRTDPRAAALSSLSMGLFGTITVLFTSIPPISSAVRASVGL
ncbi:hypothetical protein SLS62_000416 [Diatrype stigma]|uniref:Plastidal glycolate/glycerate translocator 1 n=1 Tax=Diatrype stigma TaxID=117547 RepID=A0AAN9UXH9_9PEZI